MCVPGEVEWAQCFAACGVVEFVDWLRPELKFEGREALIAAMHEDIENARQRLDLAAESRH